MVDVVAGCKRGVEWFKGILKSVWELLKKIFTRPRKGGCKSKQSQSGGGKPSKSPKNKQQGGDCGDNESDGGEQSGQGNEGDDQEADGGSQETGDGEECDGNGEISDGEAEGEGSPDDSRGEMEQCQREVDAFHERVAEAERRGEFEEEIGNECDIFEESDEQGDGEDIEAGEGEGSDNDAPEADVIEPTITKAKPVDAVQAALEEMLSGETTESTIVNAGRTAGGEVEIIDASELQGMRRLTIIPDQTRETRAVYD